MEDELAAFVAEERLPDTFSLTVERVCRPLAHMAAEARAALGHTAVIGLCGAQGSGKSTIAAASVRILQAQGLNAVTLSLDDFYLSREARGWLSRKVHPLLAVRGPPGTHDVALACVVLDHLSRAEPTPLPAFDKALDERRPQAEWREAMGPVDVAIFEGWCVGARPQPKALLSRPVNELEQMEDRDGRWRRYVDRALAEAYQALFSRLDRLVLLAAPGFEVVRDWRTEQEHKLRDRTGAGMDDAAVARFVEHYERLTRWILEEMPGRADWTVPLAADRTPLA
ncbi:MAG: kinase [Phenylobacterium sp.]|uniref:kinase n=1 Tax=Phenylobacterium sp. TaxID=1871053 RepID=UPI001212D5EC|nr:kinase [Phenylobacterium sp.]TAJ73167.1 MAG: kinase [Phenylobacterium sp.]